MSSPGGRASADRRRPSVARDGRRPGRRGWRGGAVIAIVIALVLQASPAFAFRTSSVSGNTQTFTQAGAADLVATYSSTAPMVNLSATTAWPWSGASAAMYTPTITGSPTAKQFENYLTGCDRTVTFATCANRGTITLTFTRAGSPANVTNPILNLAGFGGDSSTGNSQFASTLTIATAGVTFGAPSAGATNLSVDTANTRVLTTSTRPSTDCNNSTGGNSPNGTAGCGSVQLTGTFSSVTFNIGARISQTVGTGTFTAANDAYDTIRLNLTLQDEALPTAVNDAASTTTPTAVTTNVVANDTPVSGVPFRTTNPVTFGNDTTLTTSNAAGSYTASGQSITFSPVAGFVGAAPAVTYRVTDVNGSFATATYTVTVLGAAFSCAGTIYRSNNSSVAAVTTTAVGAGAVPTTTFVTLPTTVTATYAMGMSADGQRAFFVGSRTGVTGTAIITYTAGSATPFTSVSAGSMIASAQIAGAVNPVNGFLYFGGTATASALYMYNPTTGVTIQVGMAGGALASATGDYAFTAGGDLLFLGGSTLRIVAAANVPTTAGTAMLTPTLLASAGATGDGIAFGSDGYLYTQSNTTIRRTNPTTAIALATSTAAFSGTDMASCAAGSTVTVRKNLSARVKAADQFALNVAGTGMTTQTATTSGATTGLQPVAAGPVPIVPAGGLTVSETAAGGTVLAEYLTSYQCLDQTGSGTGLPSGSAASFALTTSAGSGQAVVCTFSNGPLPDGTGTIRVQKMLVPFGGTTAQATPAPAGWQFAASTSAIRTSIIAPATASTSAAGLVSFGIQFLSPTSTGAVTVTETQQDRYTLLQTGGFNAACINETTGTAVTVTNSGALGFTVTATREVSILCTVYNQRQQEISCDNVYAYAWNRANPTTVPANIYQVNTTTGALTTVAQVANASAYTNALAVDASTNTFWTTDQNGATALTIRSVNDGTGAQTIFTSPTFSPSAEAVAGAIDARTGIYYVGAFSAGTIVVFGYNTRTSTWLGLVARLPMSGTSPAFSGTSIFDFAFDGQGRLYYGLDATGGGARYLLATVQPVEALTSAANADVRLLLSTTPPAGSVGGGMAFGADGYLYFATATVPGTTAQLSRINTSSGAVAATTPMGTGVSIGDLASCATPSTVTLVKNLPDGRARTTDQFGLSVTGGGLALGNTGTTTGTETGVQNQSPAEIAGPVLTLGGTAYTITETASGTTNLSYYSTTWRCVDQATGTVVAQWATGPPTAGSYTTPAATALGVNLLCTFTNAIAPITVTVSKQLVDAQGLNPVARPGWTVGAAFVPGAGTAASVTPAATPTQLTDAAGRATWTALLTGTAAPATTVNISEVQQAGYEFVTGQCVITRAGVAQPPVTITSATAATPVTNVVPGDALDCTYANRLLPTTLTLVKTVTSGSALATAWTITATAPTGALPGPTGATGTPGTTAVAVTPAVPYVLSESGGPATYVQVGTWTCVNAQGTAVPVTGASVTIAIGTRVTCTVRNGTSTITLLKQVILPLGTVSAATWNLVATPAALAGLTPTTVAGATAPTAANTFETRPGHSYTLDEVLANPAASIPYRFARLEVQGAGGTWSPVSGFDVVAPAVGQTSVYRFVNEPYLPPPIPLTGGGAADTYLILGGLLFGSSVVLVLWSRRRRRMR